jgi:RNA binding exosome subunit
MSKVVHHSQVLKAAEASFGNRVQKLEMQIKVLQSDLELMKAALEKLKDFKEETITSMPQYIEEKK